MSDWFSTLAVGHELPVHAASELEERGCVVLPGMVVAESLERLITAYTEAVTSAIRRSGVFDDSDINLLGS